MYKNKIIHRDLKPDNILLNEASEYATTKIMDLGLSRISESVAPLTKTAIGAPLYASPEILKAYNNEKADLWSIRCILYKILTGCLPFYAKNIHN